MAYSNSQLISYTKISPYRDSPRNQPISKITIHHCAGVLTLEQFGDIVTTPNRDMSANYCVDKNGRIGLFCPESDRSWCSSSSWNDNRAITIEVSNNVNSEPWSVSNVTYTSLIKLCVDICQRNGIKKLEFTGDIDGSLTYHYMYNNTQCPGTWIKNHTSDIVTKVNNELAKNPSLTDLRSYVQSVGDILSESANVTAAEYATAGTTVSVEPDYKEIQSYMITLDRTSKKVDYEALRGIGVVGTMLEAGYMYDQSHMEVNTFVSPALASQVAAAKEADMPYSLFTYTRARNIKDANLELKWLRIYIQKYVPPLGVWLKLELANDISMNDMIVGRYKTLLEASGLKGKIGFYVTRQQLVKITWSKWQEDFLLWLVDYVDNVDEFEKLLDPTFFDL